MKFPFKAHFCCDFKPRESPFLLRYSVLFAKKKIAAKIASFERFARNI
jgi:hypothetical protein